VPLTTEEKQARIEDLLTARSGVYLPSAYQSQWQRDNLPPRGSQAAGTFWYYNNWDFNALGTIFEQVTGSTIGDAFQRDIAEPTGMQDFKPTDVVYVQAEVSLHRAYPFRVTARDLARFGLLYLSQGRWEGRQVIPDGWVEDDGHFPGVDLGGGAFSAQGAGGHYIVV